MLNIDLPDYLLTELYKYTELYEKLRQDDRIKDIVDFPFINSARPLSQKMKELLNWADGKRIDGQAKIKDINKILEECNNNPEIYHLKETVSFNEAVFRELYSYESCPPFCDCLIYMTLFLLYLIKLQSYRELKIQDSNGFSSIISSIENDSLYWRGQSHSSYGLIPSIYRNLEHNQLFSFEDIIKLYENQGLTKKYNSIFGTRNSYYSFFSYMQHSIAYSPFLDITKRGLIAGVFANYYNSDMNLNDYENCDSAIFYVNKSAFTTLKDESSEAIIPKSYCVQYISKAINPKTMIFKKFLFELDLKDLATQFYLDDDQPNDRMRYQHGSFLIPFHGVIIHNNMLGSAKPDEIGKIIIPHEFKNIIYQNLVAINPQFRYEYLMNPYLYFGIKE